MFYRLWTLWETACARTQWRRQSHRAQAYLNLCDVAHTYARAAERGGYLRDAASIGALAHQLAVIAEKHTRMDMEERAQAKARRSA